MEEFGAGDVFKIVQHIGHVFDVVAVDRAKVAQSEGFEEIALFQKTDFKRILDLGNDLLRTLAKLAHLAQQVPDFVADLIVSV